MRDLRAASCRGRAPCRPAAWPDRARPSRHRTDRCEVGAEDAECPSANVDVLRRDFQQVRGDLLALVDDRAARPRAAPSRPTGSAREPPVSPRGVRSVSPMTTSMRSASMPSWSETSCLYEVTRPGAVFLVAHHQLDALVLELDRRGLGEAAAAALRVGRHADAAELAALACCPARAPVKRRPVGRLHAAFHHLLELAGIDRELGRRRVGHADGGTKLMRRISSGVMSSSRAAASTSRSSR